MTTTGEAPPERGRKRKVRPPARRSGYIPKGNARPSDFPRERLPDPPLRARPSGG